MPQTKKYDEDKDVRIYRAHVHALKDEARREAARLPITDKLAHVSQMRELDALVAPYRTRHLNVAK
jgi:hypothetical protein